MKKNRINPTQIIAGTLASVIFVQSCSKPQIVYYQDENIASINMLGQDYDNSVLLPLDINIDSQMSLYLSFLNELGADIISNPQVAQEFLSSPTDYLQRHGFSNITIDLDESLLNMVLLFADDELSSAIMNNDVASFVQICNTKGYIKVINDSRLTMIKTLLGNNKDLIDKLSSMDSKGSVDGDAAAGVVAFALAIAVGAAVAVWAVLVTHVGAGNVALLGTFHVYAAATTYTWKGKDEKSYEGIGDNGLSINNSELIKIWLLKGGDSSQCNMITDINDDLFVDQLIDVIRTEIPEKAEQMDMDLVRNTLKLNLNMLNNGKACY
ncbi:MAG: hypothetical protein IKI09_05140 [Bacteroidales bacterium]|nr:hypothetical protein [Bacteroidales bacterium]